MFFGQNVGVNSPRMLHQLKEVRERGVPIITFNPLRERGLESFTDPQSPIEMRLCRRRRSARSITSFNRAEISRRSSVCRKRCWPWMRRPRRRVKSASLTSTLSSRNTSGFEAFVASMDHFQWPDIEACSGLSRAEIKSAARVYCNAKAVIICYGMGLTQHRSGVLAIQMLSNLLLMRGNIGKPGAGIFPVRGHSNVQGQRTVGITEKPDLVPLDRLAEQYGFNPPRERGLDTVGPAKPCATGA